MDLLRAKFDSLYEKVRYNKEMIPGIKMERLEQIAAAFKRERDPVLAKVILSDLESRYGAIFQVYKELAMGPRVVYSTVESSEPLGELVVGREVVSRYIIDPELYEVLRKK